MAAASVYLRYPFQVDDASIVEAMVLKMKVDDGFVAYLNGELIGLKNDRTPLLYNAAATQNEEVEVGDRWYDLRMGEFGEGNIESIIDAMAADLTEAQARNSDRWSVLTLSLIHISEPTRPY